MKNKKKINTVEVVIGFNIDDEEIKYIKSDFMDENLGFKDGIDYTAKLIEMALNKWIRENIGVYCPNCEAELDDSWEYCPSCGKEC